jgi:hypothetical protein
VGPIDLRKASTITQILHQRSLFTKTMSVKIELEERCRIEYLPVKTDSLERVERVEVLYCRL